MLTDGSVVDIGGQVMEIYFTNLEPKVGTPKTNNFDVFPNPTDGQLNLDFADLHVTHLQVVDAAGRLVFDNPNVCSVRETLNLQDLPDGVYFVRAKNARGWLTERVVRSR